MAVSGTVQHFKSELLMTGIILRQAGYCNFIIGAV